MNKILSALFLYNIICCLCIEVRGEGAKILYDDGNIVETVQDINSYHENESNTEKLHIQESEERGTHHFGRKLLKPFVNAANRIGKVLNRVTETAGLDTNTTFFSGAVESFKMHIKAIYPGTRWCGDGDKARFDNDFGTFEATDKCCRAHDKCFDFIAAGESKHGLKNPGLFTRSHCTCDNEFYQCLKDAHGIVSGNIGFTYFSVLGPQCFKEAPYAKCQQYSRGKCISYIYDDSKGNFYQWFDSPMYI